MSKHDVLLRARGITKTFAEGTGSKRKILNRTNLEVRRRSLVVIRGESGSGKSTLLRILGLIDDDFEGAVEICGEKVFGGKKRRQSAAEVEALRARHIGFVFQEDLLLPLLSLRENSELPARIHRIDEIRNRLKSLQSLVFREGELGEGVMERRRTRVSGGQRQRAAILRALSHDPVLILADEPTASLDPEAKDEVVRLFRQLCDAGATILVASHDSVFQDAGEIYTLNDGKLLRESPEQEVEQEAGEESADFADFLAPEPEKEERKSLWQGCPPSLQAKLAFREARGNPLFAFMIMAAMAAGLFQLTLMWSIQAGTEKVLDEVINKGSRLDRVEVTAKATLGDDGGASLPSEEVLQALDGYRRTVPRREVLLRVDDSRGRERRETAFGLVADDPEIEKFELREGAPFDDQQALAVLITERSVERLFGAAAVDEPAAGKTVPVRFRRYPAGAESPEDMEEKVIPFTVRGVLDRAEAGRNIYLPQGTLLAVAAWQMGSVETLDVENDRLALGRAGSGEPPSLERLHIYFDRLDQVLPATAQLERQGFATKADLSRYKWILDTRRFVSWMLGGIVAMVLCIAGLLIVSNVISSVRLKRKEIAVLKLMGMKDRDVVTIFVLSVLACSLLGGIVGFSAGSATVEGIGAYLTSAYPDSPLGRVLTSTWAQAGYALLLCSLVTIVFTVVPAWQTARKEAVWKLD